jgi:tRNA(fMet)-specific endonuclease VapC
VRYLLDTDTASYAIRGAFPALDTRLALVAPRDMAISVITRAELLFGLEKRGNPRGLARVVHAFLDRMTILPWDNAAADTFAKLRMQLERQGTPIGFADTMIGAHALALKAALVTNNQKHFKNVKGLLLENWIA